MTRTFVAVEQLEKLLRRFPLDPVDLEGPLLDYLGRTGSTLVDVFRMNTRIYDHLFVHNQDPTVAHAILRIAIHSSEDAQALATKCERIFPAVSEALQEIRRAAGTGRPSLHPMFFDNPGKYLGHDVDLVFWQISDLHFGKYNSLDNNPRELAAMLAKLAVDYSAITPELILVSGDVSSVAADLEFAQFIEFTRHLSDFLRPGRGIPVLVVPGNHDVRWQKDGSADRMAAFAATVGSSSAITPFGPPEEALFGGAIRVRRYHTSPSTVPPFATVTIDSRNVEFVLLVSGYFSGGIPLTVRTLLEDSAGTDQLLQLLRTDEGAINREYLLNLASSLAPTEALRIAVIHHNPVGYGLERCANRFAPQLLETLFMHDTSVVLHGHVHLGEDLATRRPISPGRAYPVPCPTLASLPTSGGRGLNVCMLGKDGAARRMAVLVWDLSTSGDFKPEGLRLRYQLTLRKGMLEVTHGYP